MTTVAVRDGIMASDSLITGSFIDSARKIRRRGGVLVGFAGGWIAAATLADYYLNPKGDKPTPDGDDDVDLLVLKPSGIYLLDKFLREVKVSGKYYAIGSGSQAAMVAMNMGATAVEAVRQAIKVDESSSGPVRRLSLNQPTKKTRKK